MGFSLPLHNEVLQFVCTISKHENLNFAYICDLYQNVIYLHIDYALFLMKQFLQIILNHDSYIRLLSFRYVERMRLSVFRNLIQLKYPFLIFSILIFLGLLNNCFSQTFKPNDITGLQAWFKADSANSVHLSGSNVAQWNDCSGQGNDLIQAAGANQPLYIAGALNGLPVIEFNGTSDYMKTAPFTLNQPEDIFIVYKPILWGMNKTIFDGYTTEAMSLEGFPSSPSVSLYAGTSYAASNSNATVGRFHIVECFYGGANSYLKVDNSTQTIGNPGISNAGGFELGGMASYITYCSNIDVAEVIIYNRNLTNIEKLIVETYVSKKYAEPPVNLGPDININYGFCDTTLDAGSNFASYYWSTGETTQTISVNKKGIYSVTATDTLFGFPSIDSVKVTYPQINLRDTLFCQGDSIPLDPQLSGHYLYQWSNGKTTAAIYAKTPGQYWVVITDTNNCIADTVKVNVTEDTYPSLVSLGSDTLSFCAGNAISLVSGAAQALSYQWSTTETTSSIVINAPGDYSVTATDVHGCKGIDTTHVKISGIAPSVGFSFSGGCSNDSISFSDTSKVGSATIVAWYWNFGDGFTSNLHNPKHKFLPGPYIVKDSVVTSTGCSNFKTRTIHINASPVAAFSVSAACSGHPYAFTDLSTFTSGDSISSWDWDFGDGSSHSNLQNPTYNYPTANGYNVTLTVQTDSGCSNTVIHPITVVTTAAAPASFSLYLPSNGFVTADDTVNFAWNMAPGAVSYTLEYSTDPTFSSGVTSIPNIITTSTQQIIGTFQTYYWHVIANGICGDPTPSNIFSFTLFQFQSIPGLQLWFMSDSVHVNVNHVDTLVDCSGLGHHATQSTAGSKPLFVSNALNGHPVIEFDGVNDFMKTAPFPLTQPEDVFIVFKPVTWIANSYLFDGNINNSMANQAYPAPNGWGIYAGGASQPFNLNAPIGSYNIMECLFNGANSFITIDGIIVNGTLGSNNAGGFTLAEYAGGGSYSNDDIAEVIIYNQPLNPTERQNVENYLHTKYVPPPVNLGPDIWSNTFCDTTLDASQRFIKYKWSTGDTTSKITVNTSGTYWISVTDAFGFHSSDTVIVHKPTITAHDTLACMGSTVTLHAGLSSPYTFNWNGGISTADSLVVSVPSTNTLTVTDTTSLHCSITKIIHVLADFFPVTASLGSPPTITKCKGDTVYLINGAGAAASYVWFDGTDTSYGTSYLVTWPPPSTHSLFLTVTDHNGCVATFNMQVFVPGIKPNVGFLSDSGCVALHAVFNDTTSNAVYPWIWNYGDGYIDSLTSSSPSHIYTIAGTYQVTLTITTAEGCSATVTEPAKVYSKPVPSFTPLIGCDGVPLQFQDHTTSILGAPAIWNWNFGDTGSGALNTSAMQDPSHTYNFVTALDSVKLIVTTQYGCTDSVTKYITIRSAPAVGFTYTSVCGDKPVYFNDTSSTQPWNQIIEWDWNFGNDSSNIQNPVYTFDSGGTYPVILTVKSINGCTVTDTEHIVVHAIPVAKFFVTDVCEGAPYTLQDSSSVLLPDNITQWAWNFGSLGTSGLENPTITYPDTGNFQISLFVQSNAGCNNNVSHYIHVNPVPVASFFPSSFYGVAPFPVSFTNNSQGASYYLWDFGDGIGSSSLINPNYTYTYDSTFNVHLIAYNQYTCTDDTSELLMVIPTIADIAIISIDTTIQGDYISLSVNIANHGTQKIYKMDISVEPQGGGTFTERWMDMANPLNPANTMTYHFNAKYLLTDKQLVDYICVEAQMVGITDSKPSDNVQCIPLNNDFVAYNPYPTPVSDQVHIDFILPFSDNVEILLYGQKGDIVKTIYSGAATKGLNRLTVDVSSLDIGMYTYRIRFRDEQKILRFVKF
jgi:PKD repeat protein